VPYENIILEIEDQVAVVTLNRVTTWELRSGLPLRLSGVIFMVDQRRRRIARIPAPTAADVTTIAMAVPLGAPSAEAWTAVLPSPVSTGP